MAKWIRITGQYDHVSPSHAVTSYPPGVHLMDDAAADAAIAKGMGEPAAPPQADEARISADVARREAEALDAAATATDAEAANKASAAANRDARQG